MRKQIRTNILIAAALIMVGLFLNMLSAQEQPVAPVEPVQTADSSQKASDLLKQETEQKEDQFMMTIFGPGMWPLWLSSLILLTLVLERYNALKHDNIIDDEMVEKTIGLVSDNKISDAWELTKGSETVVGKAWAQGFHEFLLGGVSMYEGLTNSTILAFKPLKRNLQAISTVAVVSPLLGLLGTVVGMIITFNQISATGGADKAQLAGGIGLALFTTAGGLIIAIPAIICGRYFSSRLTGLAEQAEAAINRINYRHTHALAQGGSDGSRVASGEGEEKEEKKESDQSSVISDQSEKEKEKEEKKESKDKEKKEEKKKDEDSDSEDEEK